MAIPESFEQLAASRRAWIDDVLRPWCQASSIKELRKAEAEWFDLAGRADIGATLWTWAWERFPAITHPDLPGVHETHEVQVTMKNGEALRGYPDARKSIRGTLVLVNMNEVGEFQTLQPVSLDDVAAIERV
jgi:hypothetical protein